MTPAPRHEVVVFRAWGTSKHAESDTQNTNLVVEEDRKSLLGRAG
jgi:hypothetical protein